MTLAPLVIPERAFGPCSKCGGLDIHVRFHDGKPAHCSTCSVTACKYSDDCGERGIPKPHLLVHCRRCQHGWTENPGPIKAASS